LRFFEETEAINELRLIPWAAAADAIPVALFQCSRLILFLT